MIYKKGDMLCGDWDVAYHCANVYKTFGSGVAYYIAKKWPEVYQADIDGDNELGFFTKGIIKEDGRTIYNLYGQKGVGNDGHPLNRNCSYDHLYDAIYRACEDATRLADNVRVGIPQLGCGLAGGSWTVVEAIIKDVEEKTSVEFTVYVL